MLIYHIKIENFRGIKAADFTLAQPVICLVGAGDSTKSTILDAIEYVLSSNWHLPFDDSDFSNCDLSSEFKIEITIGPVPDDLVADIKFGLHLRGWNGVTKQVDDEPKEDEIKVLTVRLKVDRSLIPEWFVVNDRNPEGIHISFRDRQKFGVTRIGINVDSELAWVKGASLLRFATDKHNADQIILEANRQLRDRIDLNCISEIQNSVESARTGAISLGLHLGDLKADLDPRSLRAGSAIISLHNDRIPTRRMGLGSKRIIAIGSQLQCAKDGCILLIDEVEHALEPHRIKFLTRRFAEYAQGADGQIIMTTHSPAVLEELGAEPLFIVRSKNLETTVQKASIDAQGTVRSIPDAFLSPRAIICEGATEVGILRSFENNILLKLPDEVSFALYKTIIIDGGGHNASLWAKDLRDHGYDVCLFVDSDNLDKWKVSEAALLAVGVRIVKWNDSVCTEKRIIEDIPDGTALREVVMTASEATKKDVTSLMESINSRLTGSKLTGIDDIVTYEDRSALRKAIYESSTAKDREWFKTVSRGKLLGDCIFQKWFSLMLETDFCKKLDEIKGWVVGQEQYSG